MNLGIYFIFSIFSILKRKLYTLKNMKILFIGGAGYIGSALVTYFQKNDDCSITVVDNLWFGNYLYNNINSPVGQQTKIVVQDYSTLTAEFLGTFDAVILTAGHSSVKMCMNEPFKSMCNNVFNFFNLCHKLLQNQKFIYISSSSVYGNSKDKMVDENYNDFVPNNEYDLEKLIVDEYMKTSKLYYYALRLGTVNGLSPNMREELMINSMFKNAMENKQINISNPKISRPILWIADLCRAVQTILRSSPKPGIFPSVMSGTPVVTEGSETRIYNLASFNHTVEDIGNKLSQMLQVPLNIVDIPPIENITNEKLQTNNYDFSISSDKFIETFSFEFKGTIETIVDELKGFWINSDTRSNKICPSSYKNMSVELERCLICDQKVESLVDLGFQPMANNYHASTDKYQVYFPLILNVCRNCEHSQLSHSVNPDRKSTRLNS